MNEEEAVIEAKFGSSVLILLRLLPFVLIGCLGLSSCSYPAMPDYHYHLRYWEDYGLRGDRLMQDGKFNEAAQFYKSSVQEAESLGAARLCYSLNRLSGAYLCDGRYADALKVAERSFAICGQGNPHSDNQRFSRDEFKQEIALACSRLAELRLRDKNYSQADELYKQAVELLIPLWESSRLAGHSFIGQQLVQALSGQALTDIAAGRSDAARECFKKALSLMSKVAVPAPIADLITQQYEVLSTAEVSAEESAKLQQARRILEHADASKSENSSSDREAEYKQAAKLTLNAKNARPEFARAAQGLADIYALRREPRLAITWYEEELGVLRELVDSDTLGVSHPVLALAGLYTQQNNYSSAERMQQLRVDALSHQQSVNFKELSQAQFCLAWSMQKQGKLNEAVEYLKQSIANAEKAHNEKSDSYVTSLVRLARLLDGSGKVGEALSYFKRAVDCGDKFGTISADDQIDFVDRIKNICRDQKNKEECAMYTHDLQRRLDEWLSTHKELESKNPRYAFCLRWVGQCYVDEGKFDKAERIFKRAITLQKQLLGPNDVEVALTELSLGDLYFRSGRKNEIEPVDREALTILNGLKEPRKAEKEVILYECPQLKDAKGDSRDAGK